MGTHRCSEFSGFAGSGGSSTSDLSTPFILLCTLTQLHLGHPDHPAPEGISLFNGQAVSPGDHGHHIHSPAQPPQELNVQRPKAARDRTVTAAGGGWMSEVQKSTRSSQPSSGPPAASGSPHQWPVGGTKYTQQCTRVSGMWRWRVMRSSS